ncbi:alpha/beta hydrolase [Spirulina subsalsa FACHB-351]|uniref:Alpha/beta hydrolase n=1 Tax=Spirulina subsalsa FACHB-351 TaxID=234711 RepID=A0ABT3L447_9CYAN|nr:alpha/beta hydrolase [Spirulina subsalsa]MCW6036277.1 alpha/beta hydrolase [Spirulina subsalsa FACHB-351]
MLAASYLSQLKQKTLALTVSTTALLATWGGAVSAAEVINFKYNALEISVPTRALVDFVETGDLEPEVQSFLEREVGTDFPSILRQILGTEIRVSSNFVRDTLGSSLGEFALLQIDKAINQGTLDTNVAALREAIRESVEANGMISLIDVIERYPMQSVNLDLTGLQVVYDRVSRFLEDIEPALRTARQFLQEMICDCEPGSMLPGEGATLAVSPSGENCVSDTTLIVTERAKALTQDSAVVAE